jgi:ferredoxin-NADP reductase/uncharacterized protein YcbX
MAVDEAGLAITGRDAPSLLSIAVERERGGWHFHTNGHRGLVLHDSNFQRTIPASIWGDAVDVLDAGEAAAQWLSAVLGRAAKLVLKPDVNFRETGLKAGAPMAFADTAPLLAVNAQSLAELNRHIDFPVPMARFRPNIVVDNVPAFDEDNWSEVTIGNVIFDVMGPCDRCVMVTLDAGGKTDFHREPLGALTRHRRGLDGKVYFGQFLVPRSSGRLNVGDPVRALYGRSPPALRPVPSAPARLALPARPTGQSTHRRDVTLTCVGVIEEAHGFKTFRFESSSPLAYLPGQFITIKPVINGESIARNYTLSSSPSRPAHISISVRKQAGGLVSTWLHDQFGIGQSLSASGPAGRFHLGRVPADQGLFMASAGSGITPMISMLRYIADHNLALDIHFHHTSRFLTDRALLAELEDLQRVIMGLKLSWNITGEPSSRIEGLRTIAGRLLPGQLARLVPDLGRRTVLCCGPDGYRHSIRQFWEDVEPDKDAAYLEESFGVHGGTGADLLPIGPYTVSFGRRSPEISGEGETTLLKLARKAGIAIPSDCEVGICGTCRCRVRKGSWRLSSNCADPEQSILEPDEKAAGVVLACSTAPVGDVEIDLL